MSTQPVSAPDLNDLLSFIDPLIECGRDFHHRGWSLGTSSNYSAVVCREPLTLVMTGSGFDKGALQPEQFLVVNENAESLTGPYPKPSAEALLHTTLAKRTDIGAVLHTHSICGTVLSEGFRSDGELRLRGYEMLKGLNGIATHEAEVAIKIFANTQDIVTLAHSLEECLLGEPESLRHGFLLAGHGLYTWGGNLAAARRQVEALEFLFEVVTKKKLLFGSF